MVTTPTAFRVHLTRGMWRCFTACGGGDTVDLIRCIENCSYAEAARYLYLTILPAGVNGVSQMAFPKEKSSTMPTGPNLPEPMGLLLWSVPGLQ